MGIVVRIDDYLIAKQMDYYRMYLEIEETQTSLSDNILAHKTHKLKKPFSEIGLTSADDIFLSFMNTPCLSFF